MSGTTDISSQNQIVPSKSLQTTKDIIAGAAGGSAQVLIGQPFDIVKVRLQTQAGGNVTSVTRDILFKEGPLAFYKGTLLPLLGIGACVSIQFGAFHSTRRYLEDYNRSRHGITSSQLSYTQYYLSGAVAGLANSVIANPVEHVRIRLQTQPDGAKRIYAGPQDCLRQIIQKSGFAGLNRGMVPCLIREFHGFGLWFVTYEALMDYDMQRVNRSRKEIPLWNIALYGGIAGEVLWLGTYPVDVIKSKMQCDGFGQDQQYRNMRAAFVDTWRRNGTRGLFRGIGPTLVRTMFTSGATFVTAEQVKQLLN